MRARRTGGFVLFTVLLFSAFPARAGGPSGVEAGILVGAAFSSSGSAQAFSGVDEYGTATTNVIGADTKTGYSFGVSVRYVDRVGIGLEVAYERARRNLDATTPYALKWDSITGPQSESYALEGSGRLLVEPVSVNLLYRASVMEKLGVTVSGGVSFEHVDLEDRRAVGLVTYVGDSIETFAAETSADASTWKTTWNAGLGLDYGFLEHLSLFFDGRYYGNAKATVSGRSVEPGSYAGLHLGAPVVVDATKAAAYTTQIGGASTSSEIDTKMFRAAVGVRYRF